MTSFKPRVRPQIILSPSVVVTPETLIPAYGAPFHAAFASVECVAQNPWVRVTPRCVFSKTHVTVSPYFRMIVAVRVLSEPAPELPPEPLTVQDMAFGSGAPPIPVRIHPSETASVAE